MRLGRRGAPAAVLALAVGACAPEPQPPGAEHGRPPSLLLVTLDTARRDVMGFHGSSPTLTPFLDDLARESVVFENAWTVAPLTLPAHTSLLTGLYPSSHQVHDNAMARLSPAAVTLAEVLGEAGYRTGAAVASFVLDPLFGLSQGFDSYDAPPRDSKAPALTLTERPGDVMVARARQDLAGLQPPFFYWLHLFDPHFPYQSHGGTAPPLEQEAEGEWQQLRRQYQAEIRFADQELGRLLAELRLKPWWDELIVVFASDHGESLGDAPESTHGYFVYNPTMRIPLLLRHPSLEPRRVAGPVSLVDVMPTVLSLVGLETRELSLDGRDLADLLHGAELPDDRTVAFETWYPWLNLGWAPFEGCVEGSFKLIRSHRQQVFDLSRDPGEQQDLATEQPRILRAMLARLEATLARPAVRLDGNSAPLDAETRARLQALGYAASGMAPGRERPDFDVLPDPHDKVDQLRRIEQVLQAQAEGRLEEAAATLRTLCREEPGSAEFHEQLGTMLLGMGEDHLDDAENHLRSALALRPTSSRAHGHLGHLLLRRAVRDGDRYRRRRAAGEPRAGEDARKAQQAQVQAEEAFRQALALEPTLPSALEALGRMVHKAAGQAHAAGRVEEALTLYRESLDLLARFLAAAPRSHPQWQGAAALHGRTRARVAELEEAR